MFNLLVQTSQIFCMYFLCNQLYPVLFKNIIKHLNQSSNKCYYYIDNKPKPKYRGILHGIMSYVIIALLIYSFYTNKPIQINIFLYGKFSLYFASAIYHLYPFKSSTYLKFFHSIDLIVIPLAAHSGITMFANNGMGFFTELYIVFGILFTNIILILIKNTYNNTKYIISIVRHGIIAMYSGYVLYISGKSVKYNYLWWSMVFTYIGSFYCAGLVDKCDLCNPPIQPIYFYHHKQNVWSIHEDMHLLIFIADIIQAILSMNYYHSELFITN